MICGQTPFTGIGLGEVIAKHQYEPPPLPRTLAPGLPPRIDALISRMLAKAPDQRPQTMSEVLAVLDGAAPAIATGSHETPAYAPTLTPHDLASPTSPSPAAPPHTVPQSRRRTLYAGLAVTAGLGAIAVTTVVLRNDHRPAPAPAPDPDASTAVLALLPENTAFVVALDATRLERTPLWHDEGGKLIARFETADREHNLQKVRTQCDLDPVRDLRWVAYAYPTNATNPADGAFVIDGAWNHDKLESCLALMAPEMATHAQPAELTGSTIRQYGGGYIAWINPHTAAIASQHSGLSYLRALIEHVPSPDHAPLAAETANVDRDASPVVRRRSAQWPTSRHAAARAARPGHDHLDVDDARNRARCPRGDVVVVDPRHRDPAALEQRDPHKRVRRRHSSIRSTSGSTTTRSRSTRTSTR